MKLSKHNAEQIVHQINDVLPQRINLMDTHGIIIASTDAKRIGSFHGGADKILRENIPELRIHSDDEYEGARRGTNFLLRVQGEPIGVLGITGPYEEILPYARLLKKMTELLVKEHEIQRQNELTESRRTRFLMEWILHSDQVNKNFLKQGLELKIDLRRSRRILAVMLLPAGVGFDLDGAERTFEKQVRRLDASALICKTATELLVFSCAATTKSLLEFARTLKAEVEKRVSARVVIGVDRPADSYLQIKTAYRQARKALQSTLRVRKWDIRCYDDIDVELFADEVSDSAKKQYVKKIFYGYSTADLKEAVSFLECFYENNGSISHTADSIFVHKNTVQQRLKKIFQRTGYDPRSLNDSAIFYMAIYFFHDLQMS